MFNDILTIENLLKKLNFENNKHRKNEYKKFRYINMDWTKIWTFCLSLKCIF